jgi:hypothetical protein
VASQVYQSRVYGQPSCLWLSCWKPHSLFRYLYAEPYFDLYHRPRYSKADLWFLSHRYPYRDEVDLGFRALKDQTIKAEVRRYRGLDAQISNLLYDLQQLEER